MSTATTTDQTRSDEARTAVRSVRDDRNVAWYAREDGGVYYIDEANTPVRVGEVYEVVSLIIEHASFDSFGPAEECVVEVTNHRAWPGLVTLVLAIFEDARLVDEARRL